MTNGHLDWYIREHYLELLENFRKGKIQTFEFCISFEKSGKLTSDIIDIFESNYIILSPNEKSLGFSYFLEEVFDTCEAYLQDAESRDENSEVEFKNSVEEIYFKIQNFLNTNESNLMVETESLSTLKWKAKLKSELKEELLVELGKESEIRNFSKDFSKVLLGITTLLVASQILAIFSK